MIIAETQQITATNDFDGTAPSDAGTLEYGNEVHLPAVAGGLFSLKPTGEDPKVAGQLRTVTGIRIVFGGQATWSIKIVSSRGEFLWLSGTIETQLLSTYLVDLLPDEQLKLETTAAATAMIATVLFTLKARING